MTPPEPLRGAVAWAEARLLDIYRLELDLRAEEFVMTAGAARDLLPEPEHSPRSGVLVCEDEDGEGASLGLYIDPRDVHCADTIVEETSHLLCLAWHAAQRRPVSRLILELQGEVDRWAVARLDGRDEFGHFHSFEWDGWMRPEDRLRYASAHHRAYRFCRGLDLRHPEPGDTDALLAELRAFYRAPSPEKLRRASL